MNRVVAGSRESLAHKKERYLFGVLTELYNDACRKKNEAVKRSVELTKLSKGYCGPEAVRELKNRCKLK